MDKIVWIFNVIVDVGIAREWAKHCNIHGAYLFGAHNKN